MKFEPSTRLYLLEVGISSIVLYFNQLVTALDLLLTFVLLENPLLTVAHLLHEHLHLVPLVAYLQTDG